MTMCVFSSSPSFFRYSAVRLNAMRPFFTPSSLSAISLTERFPMVSEA